jgi:hypothetical protein
LWRRWSEERGSTCPLRAKLFKSEANLSCFLLLPPHLPTHLRTLLPSHLRLSTNDCSSAKAEFELRSRSKAVWSVRLAGRERDKRNGEWSLRERRGCLGLPNGLEAMVTALQHRLSEQGLTTDTRQRLGGGPTPHRTEGCVMSIVHPGIGQPMVKHDLGHLQTIVGVRDWAKRGVLQ